MSLQSFPPASVVGAATAQKLYSNYYSIISDAVEKFNFVSMGEVLQGNKIELP